MKENISRWMDGDLSMAESEQTMKRVLASEDLRDEFIQYTVIGDAMRGGDVGAAARRRDIFAALAAEPTVFVPGAASPALAAARAEEDMRRAPALVESGRFRMGFAAAASAATVAVVGWIGFQDRTAPSSVASAGAPVLVAQSANLRGATPASVHAPLGAGLPAIPVAVNDYLAVHRQVPSGDMMIPVAHRSVGKAR
jgi:negative regulator of sigma E activity